MRRPPLSEEKDFDVVGNDVPAEIVVGAGEEREVTLVLSGDVGVTVRVLGTLRLRCAVRDSAAVRIVGEVLGDGVLACDIASTLRDESTIDVTTKFIVGDTASVSVRSIVREDDGCVSARVSHAHHHLLLSRAARAHAVPELFISEEGVQAQHAVTVTHVDDTAMAYAAARGISADDARQIITQGFLWSY